MFRLVFQIACLTFLISGCNTYSVWSDTETPKYLEVISEDPTQDTEVSLKGSNEQYFCKIYSVHINDRIQNTKICYIEVPTEVKLKSYGAKLLKTPKALIKDTGTTVLIIGYCVVGWAFDGHYTNDR